MTLRQGAGLLDAQTQKDVVVSRKACFITIAVAELNRKLVN